MKKHLKVKIGRILLGITLLLIVAIVIIPKPAINKKGVGSFTPAPSIVVHTITLSKNGFEPQKITVNKGEVVIWTNKSGASASVNSAEHPTHKLFPPLNLGIFEDGQNLQIRIYRVGEYKYINHNNPSQSGTITVK